MLSPEMPFPMAGGGSLRTASLLHYLAGRYQVDLLVFRQPGAPDPLPAIPAGLVRRVSVIDLPAHGQSFPARALRNASRAIRSIPPLVDRFSGFGREIESATAGRRYALGIIEHFWCAPYFDQVSKVCDRTVLNLHNVESHLHARCAATGSGPEGFAHRLFQHASLDLERTWLPRLLASAGPPPPRTRNECAPSHANRKPSSIRTPSAWGLVRRGAMKKKRWSFPATWSITRIVWRSGSSARKFGRGCANAGRRWFGGWWERTRRPSGNLPAAIRGSRSADRLTTRSANWRARVSRWCLCLREAAHGLKILEAWAAGLPVVSTAVGAEGLSARHGEHLMVGGQRACICRSGVTAIGLPENQGGTRRGWQIIAGKGVYMGKCMEEVRLLTQPRGNSVRYTGTVNAICR